jgi:putative ABC transport system permease protein
MKNLLLASYLSLKEIQRNRGRFLLVGLVIALITLLVLFIAGLGEGLGNGNRQYLSRLDAELIVYLEKSDFLISASRLDRSTSRKVERVDGVKAAGNIATSNTAILLPGNEVLKVSLIGVEIGKPGDPPIVEGKPISSDQAREVVIDRNAVLRSGIKTGDEITVRSVQGTQDEFYTLKVVGIVEGQSYSLVPSIFVSFYTWDRVRPKSEAEIGSPGSTVNVVAVKLENPDEAEVVAQRLEEQLVNIDVADIRTAIQNVPGYSAQQGTIQTQGVFTLLIGVLVIGGFFQIQILQKVPQIGVLKAIGASNGVVGAAAVLQIVMVTIFGVAVGGLLTFLLSLGFPSTVPISFNGLTTAIAVIALLVIGPAGGLVSVFYAVRIEPLKALRLG